MTQRERILDTIAKYAFHNTFDWTSRNIFQLTKDFSKIEYYNSFYKLIISKRDEKVFVPTSLFNNYWNWYKKSTIYEELKIPITPYLTTSYKSFNLQLNSLMRHAANHDFVQIVTKGVEFYGNNSFILDMEYNPLFISGYVVNNTSVINARIYISNKIFIENNDVTKFLKSLIKDLYVLKYRFFTKDEICQSINTFTIKSNKDLLNSLEIIIKDLSEFVSKPKLPQNCEDINEDIWNKLKGYDFEKNLDRFDCFE